jgi:hypothetical protein
MLLQGVWVLTGDGGWILVEMRYMKISLGQMEGIVGWLSHARATSKIEC